MEDAGPGRSKRWLAAAALLSLALAHVAAGQPPEAPRGARIGAALKNALERPIPPEGLAIAIALRGTDLPIRGPGRRAAVHARQQGVLDALPAGRLRLKHRYRSLAGFAGWAGRATIEALAQRDEVEMVYLDGRVRAALAQGVGLVGADTAHALGYTGAGVKVAVLDTGIDTDHPDLSDDLAAQHCFCDDHVSPSIGCCPGGDDEEENAEDDNGHGTSVAGVITSGGVAASVGAAPDAEIVAVKVLDANGEGSFSDTAAALDWVLTERDVAGGPVEGTRIVNISLGDGVEHDDPGASPCTGSNTANAIAALYGEGVAVFAASGNEGFDDGISFPACVAQAISVGGVYDAALGTVQWCEDPECSTTLCTDSPTAADTFVCHSNSDEILDLLAPNWRTRSSKLGGGTRSFGGTSASSPYAAAQAALLFQADPSLTPEDVRTLLKGNGPQVTNPDNGLSFTRSDGGAAVLQVAPPVCGDSFVGSGEDCDDGGTAGGDCCSATCTFEPFGSPCDDGDACTEIDTCDGEGDCDPGAPLVCDDGAFCNGEETCDPGPGCLGGTPPATDDGVDCTIDTCDEANDTVVHTPDDALCDDADVCTADACDAIAGCFYDPLPFCGTGVSATPQHGPAVLGLLVLASGAALFAGRRRSGPARNAD
jgi:cysteine-rich repeat protein